jgi:putative redox protein
MNEEATMATVTVHGGAAGFVQEVLVGKHRLVADEPVDGGGADAGPSPYDFLLIALGT